MKRLLSFVLSFAMVFTMFAPSVYAMETAEDYSGETAAVETVETTEETSEETVDGEITVTEEVSSEAGNTVEATSADAYLAFRKNSGDETKYNGYNGEYFMEDSVVVYITDGTNTVPVTSYEYYDGGDGVVTTLNSEGCVELDLSGAAECSEHQIRLVTAEKGYYFNFTVKKCYDVQNASLIITVNDKTYTSQESLVNPIEIKGGETYKITAVDGNGDVISDQEYFCGYGHGQSAEEEYFSYSDFGSLDEIEEDKCGYFYTVEPNLRSGVYTNYVQIGMYENPGYAKHSYSIKVTQPDGVWIGKMVSSAEQYKGDPFELKATDDMYFYVVSQGKRIPATEISVTQHTADSAVIAPYNTTGSYLEYASTYRYNTVPAEGEVYFYTIAADGTNWDFSVALPENVIYASSNTLTVYVEYDGKTVTAPELLEGTESLSVPAGESIRVWAVDLNGVYVTSKKQFNMAAIDDDSNVEVSHAKAEDGSRLYTTIIVPETAAGGEHWVLLAYDNDGTYRYFYDFPIMVTEAADDDEGGDQGGSTQPGSPVIKWGTSMDSLKEYDWAANTLEIVEVAMSDTLYIELTDTNGTNYPPLGYGITGVNGSDTSNINYYLNEDNVVVVRPLSGAKPGEFFMDFINELGEFRFYFDIVEEGGTGEESDEFTGTLHWRKEGETSWNLVSDGINYTPAGNLEVELFENIELKFTDEYGINVSDTVWFDSDYPSCVEWAWLEDRMVVRVNSSEELDNNIGVEAVVCGKPYTLNFTPVYDNPETSSKLPCEVYAEGVIGDHFNPEYVDLSEYVHPAVKDCVLGLRFIDEVGDVIPMHRVKPVISSLPDCLDVHWGFDIMEDEATGEQTIYNEWELWFNRNTSGGTYNVDFVVDDDYVTTVTFYAEGQSGGDSSDEDEYMNVEGVPVEKFRGTVLWRVSGETEWNVASEGTFVTPESTIYLDLYEYLEVKFLDEQGNNISNNVRYPRGREEGQNGYGIYNQDEGAYSAISNSSTAMMHNDGKIVTHMSINGLHYVLRYHLLYPEINIPEAEFDGYAMAIEYDYNLDTMSYVSFDEFVPYAQNYNRFGVQFFDANDQLVDSSRVQLLGGSMNGFDITLGTDRDWENSVWLSTDWQVVFNSDAMGGTYYLEFLIDGTDYAYIEFQATGDGNNGGGDSDYTECWWNWDSDEGEFVISTKNKTSIGVEFYYSEGYTAAVEFGSFDETTGEFVPYDPPAAGVEVIYNPDGKPCVVEFDGAVIAEYYPEAYAAGYIYACLVIYDENGNEIVRNGMDIPVTDEDVELFNYEFDESRGRLQIWSGPTTINADIMAEEFGHIAKKVKRIIIRGVDGYYLSTITHVEGSDVLSMFPNLETMNLFGVHTVDSGAFRNLSNLDYVYMVGVDTLGDGVFENCTALENVDLVDVKHFGKNTFKNCPELKTAGASGYGWYDVTFDNYWDDGEKILPANMFYGSSITEAYVAGYTCIGENAFYGLTLNQLYLDDYVYVIDNAFNNANIYTLCLELREEEFFEETYIYGDFNYYLTYDRYTYEISNDYAGEYQGDWQWADNVTWTLYSDGQMIFRGEGAMGDPEIYVNSWDDETYYYNESSWAYEYIGNKIVVEKGITSISEKAFYGLKHIDAIVIADGVESIGSDAFADLGYIHYVVIPESVTSIGDNAFGGNTNVQKVIYGGNPAQYGAVIGSTSQPGLENSSLEVAAEATFELDERFEEAGIRLRPAGSDDEGSYNITVPAGTQMEFIFPYDVMIDSFFVNGEAVHDERFVATSGDAWVDVEFETGMGGYGDGGNINKSTYWLFEENTLYIYGEGATSSFEIWEDAPWYDYIKDIECVVVEEGITSIGQFNLCDFENAKTIYLPSTLTKIDYNNHLGLWSLEEFIVAEGNKQFKSIGGVLLSEGGKKLIKVPACVATEDGVYTIPSTVTTVGEFAFDNIYTITKLIVPDNVTNLEWQSLRAGEEVVIGDGVTSLPVMPFSFDIKKLTLGKNVRDIHYAALQYSGNIEEIIVDEENKYLKAEDGLLLSKDGTTLYRATKAAIKYRNEGDETGYIVVPHGVKILFMRSFMDMQTVDAVQLPETLATIEKDVFSNCYRLATIYIPASVTSVGAESFWGTPIRNGRGHYDEDDNWVTTDKSDIYYSGTQTQWNKIKANIATDANKHNLVCDFAIAGKLNVLSSDFDATQRTKIIKYAAPVTEEIKMTVGVSANPITGETLETVSPMLTWAMEEYGENFSVEPSDYEDDVYVVTINAAGTYEFMAYNRDNPSDCQKFKYVVTEKATEVDFNQLKGGHTREGSYIVAAGKGAKPVLKWSGGDNKAWAAKTFTATYGIECADEYKQYVTVNQQTGEVKVSPDTPEKFEFALTYTATETNSTMGESYTVNAVYPMLAVKELVKNVLVTNENEGLVNLPIGDRVVMDQASGVTEFTFRANASNDAWAYNEFEFTAPASANFTVVDNGDNTATVTLIGGTGSVAVTAKALDGSNKTAKVTFTTGTTVKSLDITTTMETMSVGYGGGYINEYIVLAKGKSTTLTADILPSTATNKAVKWEVLGDPATATVSGTGKVDAKAPGMVIVRAVAQDGSGAVAAIGVQVVEAVTKVQMNGLENVTAENKVLIGDEPVTFTIEAVPLRNVFDANGKPIKDQFTNADIFSNVTWSVTGALAKDVSYEVYPAEYDGDGNVVSYAYAVFTAEKAGALTVKATANDGSGKSATFNVKVEQVPYAISLTAPKGTGQYERNDTPVWIIKGDTAKGITVKPTVVFNKGDKLAAVKAPYNTYRLYLDGEAVMNSAGTKYETSVKVYEAREYVLTAEDYSGNVVAEVVLDVREKSAIDLESLEIKLPNTIGEACDGVQYAVKNREFEIMRYLNGALAAKIDSKTIDAVWTVTDSLGDSAESVIVTKANGKSYLKFDNSCSGGYSITLTLTDKVNPENTVISNQINVVAVDTVNDKDMWFGIWEEGVAEGEENRIEKMGKDVLNPLAGPAVMTVNNKNTVGYCENFEVKSSNAKVLEVEKISGSEFVVTPKAAGKATLTIKALDGSNKTFTAKNITVYSADSPVAKITASGTSFSVNPQQSIVIGYGLAASAGKPEVSSADMTWTSSDERIVTVENLGIDDVTSVTDAKGNMTYTTNGRLAIHPTDKTGKVTITGTALDGSGKTVKINITVEKNGATQQLSLDVPANTANGGETGGTVVLGWGKTLRLTAALKPNKAKNKAVTYKIEAVDGKDSDNVIMTTEKLAALGVTVNKTGTVTTKAPNAKLPDPYSGWVKVTATLNYQMYDDMNDIEAVQYIYIERPMSKLRLTTVNDKGNVVAVTGKTVKKAEIDGTDLTIDLFSEYTVEATYKGYSAKVDGVMTDLPKAVPYYSATDKLLWTTSDAKLATVDQYGVVTVNEFTKKGTVTITAMAQDGSNIKMTYRITISEK